MSNNSNTFLDKMTDWFEKWLGPVAEFTNTNPYLTSISDAFTMQMPLIIVGSFALLLNIFVCSGTGLAKYRNTHISTEQDNVQENEEETTNVEE